ncbi:MAG: heme o synthase [Rhodospirillales bacterium]
MNATGAAIDDGGSIAVESAAGDFIALLKPRVMALVVFTGVAGLLLAPGSIHPVIGLVAVLCISVGAGASGAINMWFDRDIDRIMTRTRNRPVAAGRIKPDDALAFGVILSAGSVMVMGLAVNLAAAGLLALTIAFYVFVYTMWLKRRTPQNIVIGGAAGAFPPMIGWAAVTGDVSLASITLFAIIFFWTPPHFWALALFRNADYTAAGVPMLPVVAGPRETKRQMMAYTLLMLPLSVAPALLGFASPVYAVMAALASLRFIQLCVAVMRADDEDFAPARRMFGYSIVYLFGLFAALLADAAATTAGIW